MKNKEIALDYLRHFCNADIGSLDSLLERDLVFTGTLNTYKSSSEYIASLRDNPPERCRFNLISVTDSPGSVALFYEYQKTQQSILLAQLFKIRDQKIKEILLIFDGREIS